MGAFERGGAREGDMKRFQGEALYYSSGNQILPTVNFPQTIRKNP